MSRRNKASYKQLYLYRIAIVPDNSGISSILGGCTANAPGNAVLPPLLGVAVKAYRPLTILSEPNRARYKT
jgi:hypothetical protein